VNFVANYGETNYFVNFVVNSFDRTTTGLRSASDLSGTSTEMRCARRGVGSD